MAASVAKNYADVDYRRPAYLGILASAVLTVLVIVGSRSLEHFDPALFGYTIASVVALGAIVFRYAVWLQRPATRMAALSRPGKNFQEHNNCCRDRRQKSRRTEFYLSPRLHEVADAFPDHVGLHPVGRDHVSPFVRMGAFQA